MNKALITLGICLSLSTSVFSQENVINLQENFPEGFFYEQPKVNLFKQPKFKASDAKLIALKYNKYAMHDLGINEEQFKKHIDNFLTKAYKYFEDKPIYGPMLISFSLSAIKPKEENIVCSQTPKKCSLNSIEILLEPQFAKFTEPLSNYVITKLDEEGQHITDPTQDYSEPIIGNFDYIGNMKVAILVDLTPPDFSTPRITRVIQDMNKKLDEFIYPEGEEMAKKYSSLQKQYFDINIKVSPEENISSNNSEESSLSDIFEDVQKESTLNSSSHNEVNSDEEFTEEENVEKSQSFDNLSQNDKDTLNQFNQLRQKMFPLPKPKRFSRSVDNSI